MSLKNCHNFSDFRKLAKRKLPSPIFHYIDGAADDEVTYRRNTSSFDDVSLIPSVLRGVKDVDISTTVFGTPDLGPLTSVGKILILFGKPEIEITSLVGVE